MYSNFPQKVNEEPSIDCKVWYQAVAFQVTT